MWSGSLDPTSRHDLYGKLGLASQTGLNGRLSSFYNVLIVVGAPWRGCVVHLGGVSWGLHGVCRVRITWNGVGTRRKWLVTRRMCLGNCKYVTVIEQESLMVMQLPTNQYWCVSVWCWSVSAASVSQHYGVTCCHKTSQIALKASDGSIGINASCSSISCGPSKRHIL